MRGNPTFRRLKDFRAPALRARVRYDLALFDEAVSVRDQARLTHAETAAVLAARGRKTWRGKPITAGYIARLLKRFAPPEEVLE